MPDFTELLDEYLAAKAERDEAYANYDDYEAAYHLYRERSRYEKAAAALNGYTRLVIESLGQPRETNDAE